MHPQSCMCPCKLQVGTIETEWRVFRMEVLAGEARTEAEVKQHKARFRLDFAKVGTGEGGNGRPSQNIGGGWGVGVRG